MIRVAEQLLKTLHAANQHEDEGKRDEMLQELKDEVCFPIEDKVLESGVLEKEVACTCRFYYEGISLFLAKDEGEEFAQELLPVFTSMWDNSDVRCTFALTMYRFLFKRAEAGQGELLKHFIVLLKGANSLFWLDLMSLQARFQSLFAFLVQRLTDPANCIVDVDIYNDLLKLTARFIGYYSLSDGKGTCESQAELEDLSCFIQTIHKSRWYRTCVSEESGVWLEGEAAGVGLSCAAVVAVELVHQLYYIRSEEALLGMLLRTKTLRPDLVAGLDWHTRTKLQAVLHALSSPGGPLYAPRAIRVRARQLLDWLFPRGRLGRRLVNLSFRLLHPYRWPLSLAHWVLVQTPVRAWHAALEALPAPVAAPLAHAAARAAAALGYAAALPTALLTRHTRPAPS